MTSEIAKKLRTWRLFSPLFENAADHIEELQAELEALREMVSKPGLASIKVGGKWYRRDDPDRGGPYGGHAAEDCMRSMKAASAAILSLMSERDEANARALNWECRFEAASARGAAAEARIRELSLSELTALGQADENHKRALDAEARLGRAVEALREIDGHLTNMQPKLVNGPLALDKDRLAMVDRYVGPAIEAARSVLSDLEVKDDNG